MDDSSVAASRASPAGSMRRLQPPREAAVRDALVAEQRRSAELRRLHRLHAVLLVAIGHSCYDVADWFGEDPRSIERWVHAFQREGLAGLMSRRGGGRPSRLDAAQRLRLAGELLGSPALLGYGQARWSGKLVVLHLQRHYGVAMSLRQCQRLMGRLAPLPPAPPSMRQR